MTQEQNEPIPISQAIEFVESVHSIYQGRELANI
jgi:hypothetical protein